MTLKNISLYMFLYFYLLIFYMLMFDQQHIITYSP